MGLLYYKKLFLSLVTARGKTYPTSHATSPAQNPPNLSRNLSLQNFFFFNLSTFVHPLNFHPCSTQGREETGKRKRSRLRENGERSVQAERETEARWLSHRRRAVGSAWAKLNQPSSGERSAFGYSRCPD
jgi:hypothetical protein